MKRVKPNILGIIFVIILSAVLITFAMPASAKPLSITITKIACASPCRNEGLESTLESAPDFYAKIFINGQELTTTRWPNDQEYVTDPKTLTAEIPDDIVNVPVTIQIWDFDSIPGIDDLADADPSCGTCDAKGDANLDFTVNMNTGLYTGEIISVINDLTPLFPGSTSKPAIGNCAIGNGEPGSPLIDAKPPVLVCFNVGLNKFDLEGGSDQDGDGLLDSWETNGIDFDGNGTIDLVLNTNPQHKDLFVEADWMDCVAGGCLVGDTHSHKPVDGVLDDVTKAFANAPVSNPDGKNGIVLQVALDEAVPDRPNIKFQSTGSGTTDDFDDLKLGNPAGPCTGTFGTATDRASPNCVNILGAKKLVYRYTIFGHSYAETPGSTGVAERGILPGTGPTGGNISVGGNDFMVTTFAFDINNTLRDSVGGNRSTENATFMHELGHTLSLDHGGGDGVNFKPNYLSVMSYSYQFPNVDVARPLDYSSAATGTALNSLNEKSLNEPAGIGGPAGRLAIYGIGGVMTTTPANGQIDWNGDGLFNNSVVADINFISSLKGTTGSPPSPGQTLSGFDDWKNIAYNFRDSPFFADGAHGLYSPELSSETILSMNPLADLKIEKSVDKADAVGKDTLTYTAKVTNLGDANATTVSVADILPDSTKVARSLPDLKKDETNTQMFTYVVPCTIKDGVVLTNKISVTGTNPRGFPDPDLSNNEAQAKTTVRAPVLTLSKTATASINAGEAITYTITYQNTGSGGANNITINDTLPKDVYYSKALDLGTGPQPNSVVVNGDGTRTLTWLVSSLPVNSGLQTIQYTARPSLLFLGGEILSNKAILTFENTNGCKYEPLTASASTNITVVSPTKDPVTLGFWRNHLELSTTEILARVQATDQRYDTNGDGTLSSTEEAAMFEPGGNRPKVLQMQLLATYLNLATRRINAATVISSKTADKLGLHNVAQAAIYAMDTLLSANSVRYDDITRILDEINSNKNEVY